LPESKGATLVFVNGTYSEKHSSTEALATDVTIGNIAQLAADKNELLAKHLDNHTNFDGDIFSSFNKAFLKDGVFIHIPEETEVDTPIHLLFLQTDAEETYFTTSRSVIAAEKGRSEEHTSELQSRFDLVCRLLLEKKNSY